MATTFDEALEIEIAKVAKREGIDPAELRKVVKDVAGMIAYEPPGTDQVRAECRVDLARRIITGEALEGLTGGAGRN